MMKTAILIFFHALIIYLLLTLVTLVMPIMYMMSAWFALIYGPIAGAIFIAAVFILRAIHTNAAVKVILLYPIAAIAIGISFHLIEVFGSWKDVWHSGAFLLFPAAAVLAAWISIYMSRIAVYDYFNLKNAEYEISIKTYAK